MTRGSKENGKRASRNSRPLKFGEAVDRLESIRADEEHERELAMLAVKRRQELRRLAILDRCDAETKSRVIKHMEPDAE